MTKLIDLCCRALEALTVLALAMRGVGFVESQGVHSETRSALTQSYLGGAMFELAHHEA